MPALAELPTLSAADQWTAAAVRAEIGRQRVRQTDLADEIGVTQQWLNARINGVRTFSPGLLLAVAKVLGRPVEEFFPDLDSPQSGLLAQLVELRTFNPNPVPALRLIRGDSDQPRSVSRPFLQVVR